MGCTASKLDNEETVRRCKDRRRLIKDAVLARHHLAAAHSDYCRSLRLTASALSTFASGEPLAVSDTTPAVFLHTTTPKPAPIPNPKPSPPPPPPQPSTTKLPDIITRRRKSPPKLPHILSESTTPRSQFSNSFFPTAQQAHSTYSTSPSQASSVWNWENFYPPPSPPGSEYFRAKQQNHNNNPHNQTPNSEDESSSEIIESESEYNYFHSEPNNHKITNTNSKTQQHHFNHEPFESERTEYQFFGAKPKPEHEREPECTETEREEVHCSEWGDHYSTTSSSEEEDLREDPVAGGGTPPPPPAAETEENLGGDGIGMDVKTKVVVRHKDLKEIVDAIRENFEKAAVAGDRLSEMLEISKEQLDRSFKQLRSEFLLFCINFIFWCLVIRKVREN